MSQESVLNTNNNQRNTINNINQQYENYKNDQYQNELNEYANSTEESNPLRNMRVSEMTPTKMENLKAEAEKIYIDTDAVYQYAEQLKTINQNMVDEFDKVVQSMTKLETEWDASACGNAMSSFSILKDHLDTRKTQMDNYVSLINQVIVSGYEDTETSNTSLADAFK